MAPMVIDGRTVEGRARPAEMVKRVTPEFIRMAYDEGMNLSMFLEQEDPTEEYHGDRVLSSLDAFERLLYVEGLQTRSIPGSGRWASTIQDFEKKEETRLLVPELMARFWRGSAHGSASTRAVYTSTDEIVGGALRPWTDQAAGRWTNQIRPPFSLSELVAVTTPINSNAYRASYLVDSAAETRMVRVGEGAEIPGAKIVSSERTIPLYKYGRRVDQSYESLRRQRLDKVRLWVARLAIRTEMDKIAHAIHVLVNGDGNANTGATNVQIVTDLDSTQTGKKISLQAWLAFKLKFFPIYNLTHILGTEGDLLKLLMVNIGSSGTAQPTYLGDATAAPGYTPTLRDGTRYGVTADVPADKLVGVDASTALEMVTEIGSEITEVERWATRQTQTIVMSETMGFAILDPNATKTLEFQS